MDVVAWGFSAACKDDVQEMVMVQRCDGQAASLPRRHATVLAVGCSLAVGVDVGRGWCMLCAPLWCVLLC